MFKTCALEEIKTFLEKAPERYFDELEELADYEGEDDVKAYASEDCYLVSFPGRGRRRYMAMPKKADFALEKLEDFVNKQSDDFMLQINTEIGSGGKLRFAEAYETHGPILSFLTKEVPEGIKELPGTIRRLTEADSKWVMRFRQEDGQAMSLKQIFPLLVVDEIGTILAYFDEDGKLSGYASYMPTDFDIPAADEIYVLPELRRRGIGTMLAAAMAEAALAEAEACYWPVAETEAAVKTAEAAGFAAVAERMTLASF